MDLNERVVYFHEFEKQLTKNERKYWDVFRHDLFLCVVYTESTIVSNNQTKYSKNYFRAIKHILETEIHFLKSRRKDLIFAASRYLNGNFYYDTNVYDIYELNPKNFVIVETYSPKIKTSYPSFYDFSKSFYYKVFKLVNKSIIDIPDDFVKKINNYFNSAITKKFLEDRIKLFLFDRSYYVKRLKKVKPKKVFFVQNGIQKGLVQACHDLNIPIIELQHGDIGFTHPVYYYPKDGNNDYIIAPDYLFVYSKFWKDRINFPKTNIVVMGNNYNFIKPSNEPKAYDVAIFTNTLHTPIFDRFISHLLERGYTGKICYKLHPQQLYDYDKIKSNWEKYQNIDVVLMEKNSIEVIRESENIITIHSTIVFQAIDIGVRTMLYTVQEEYLAHKDVFDYPNVYLINDVSDFLEIKETPIVNNDNKRIFDKFNENKYDEVLNEIDRKFILHSRKK